MPTEPQTFDALLKSVYSDHTLTNVEFQQLRDAADKLFDQMRNDFPDSTQLTEFQQSADDAVQFMQKGILSLKKGKLSDAGKAQVIQAYSAQVAYIKANLDRFTQTL
jgi:predicted RNA-binding protein with EMAP domain